MITAERGGLDQYIRMTDGIKGESDYNPTFYAERSLIDYLDAIWDVWETEQAAQDADDHIRALRVKTLVPERRRDEKTYGGAG